MRPGSVLECFLSRRKLNGHHSSSFIGRSAMNRTNAIILTGFVLLLLPVVAAAQPRDGRWERHGRGWDYEDDDWRYRDEAYRADRRYYKTRSHHGHVRIPPGHYPLPGECRLWYVDRPPGHQPAPVPCGRLRGRRFAHAVIVSHYGVEHVGYGPRWRNRPHREVVYPRYPKGVEVIVDVAGDRGHAHVEYRRR